MANELETSLKNAAETIVKYVQDAATLTVETRYVELVEGMTNFDQARPGALTRIKLDSDSQTFVPMRKSDKGVLEVDTALLAIHDRNVASAIEYRAKMLGALLGILQGRGR